MKDFEMTIDEYLPLRDVVFNTLRRAILKGELEPGERLMEIALANKLGVSRTPIREAIRKLELEGLVVMIPRKGAEVAKISQKDLTDVLEVRRVLEMLAMELACDKITDEELTLLEKNLVDFSSCAKRGNATELSSLDVGFHDIIYQSTGNKRLIQILNNLREQMYRYRFEYIKDSSQHQNLIEEHRIIYQSIVSKDKETAAAAARTHIDNQEKAIMHQIRLDRENNRK